MGIEPLVTIHTSERAQREALKKTASPPRMAPVTRLSASRDEEASP